MVESVAFLKEFRDSLQITHQTGESDFDTVSRGYTEVGWNGNVEVLKYIDDMVGEFARADLVVSRAGATTSAELMAAGKARSWCHYPDRWSNDAMRRRCKTLGQLG